MAVAAAEATFHPGDFTEQARSYYSWTRASQEEERASRRRRPPRPTGVARRLLVLGISRPSPFPFPKKRWFLLPCSTFKEDVTLTLSLTGLNLRAATLKLETFYPAVPPFKTTTFSRRFEKRMARSGIILPPALGAVPYPSFLEEYRSAIFQNQRLRHAAGVLARHWLLKRKILPANEFDLVTMDPPVKPLKFVDWLARRIYTFELDTIRKDSIERLLMHNHLFPAPQPIRNPFTNIPLLPGQAVALMLQLRAAGRPHWALEAFAASRGHFALFRRNFAQPLRFSALRRVFCATDSDNYKQMLLEFIYDEHETHGVTCMSALYEWAIDHAAEHEKMIRWRRLCYRYYELTIILNNYSELVLTIAHEIEHASAALCKFPEDLIKARYTWHKQQLLRERRVAAAAVATQA